MCLMDWFGNSGFRLVHLRYLKLDARLPRYLYSVQSAQVLFFIEVLFPLRDLPFLQFLPRHSSYTLTY